jgi:hypothetical protein
MAKPSKDKRTWTGDSRTETQHKGAVKGSLTKQGFDDARKAVDHLKHR